MAARRDRSHRCLARVLPARRAQRRRSSQALGKRSWRPRAAVPAPLPPFPKLKPAIVHTRNLAALEATAPAWAAGVPVRIHGEHGWDIADLHGASVRLRWTCDAFYAPFVTRYVALSQHLEHYLQRRVGIGHDRIDADLQRCGHRTFLSGRRRERAGRGLPVRDPRLWLVGTVGRHAGGQGPGQSRPRLRRTRSSATPRRARGCASSWSATARCGADVERILAEAGMRELAWLPGERTTCRDYARARLLRAAVARRGHLQHDPRGDGERPAGDRHARRRQRRAGRGRRHRPAGAPRRQRRRWRRGSSTTSPTPTHSARTARRAAAGAERRFSLDRMVTSTIALYTSSCSRAAARAAPRSADRGLTRKLHPDHVRHRRHLRHRASNARSIARLVDAHERDASTTAAPTTAACTSSRASGSATGACRSSTSPPASSRSTTRTARVVVVFNGEIYNFQELMPELAGARPPLPHPQRHRGDRARLGGLGRGVREALPRHVRLRALGPQPARRSSSRATASASSRCTTRCCPTAAWSSARS